MRTLGVLLLLAMGAVSQVEAATLIWNNSGTEWSTSSNWTASGPPTAADIASFNPTIIGTSIQNPVITGSGNVASGLNLNNNYQGGAHSFSGNGTLTLGSGSIVVRGAGTQTISGPILAGAAAGNLTFNVGTSAGLTLAGATTATTNSGTVTAGGGTFTLDYSASNTAKLSGNAVTLNGGGTLALVGNASGTTLSLGNLATPDNGLGGNNVVRVTPNGAATVINFAATSTGSLRAGTRSTWDFQAASGNLGDANGARITFTSAPFISSANGLFANTASGATVGFATVTDALGKNFATYNTVGSTAIGVVSIANPGQSIATVTTVTNASGLQGLSATAKGQFNAPTGSTTVTAAIPALTLRISPASGATLAIGANNIAAAGIMLDGANDFTITGSTGIIGNLGTHYFYVNNASTTLSTSAMITSGSNATVFAGPGFVALTGTGLQNNGTSGNNYRISITGGVLRGNNTQLEFGSAATRGVINFYGGVLEITSGTNGTGASADFRRSLGTSAGNVNWGFGNADTGSGGFSAFGAAASVNIGGAATPANLIWNSTANFVGDGYALRFGSTKSDNTLTFLNPVGLDGGTAGTYAVREINVTQGTGVAADRTVFAGVISGSSSTDLLKTGTGTLQLTGANTYSGDTLHRAGIINISNASALGTGTFIFSGYNRLQINAADGASMTVANNFVLPSTGTGGEAELIRVGDGSPTAGTTARLTGVISGGSSGAIFSLDSDQGSNHNNTLILDNAANTFSGTLELWRGALAFTSDGALGNVNNTIKVNNAGFNGGLRFDAANITTASTRTFQLEGNEKIDTQGFTSTVNGAITGTGSLRKIGSGSLTLGGTNTYSGGTTNVAGGNLRVSGGAAIPDASAVTLDNTAGVGLELLANETVGSVAGGGATGGNINLNDKTLTLAAATATSFAGVISGTGGAMTKTGISVFTLTGTNTYTGGTNLNAGSLNINNGSALGTGTLSVGTTATGTFLQVANTAAVTLANNIVLPSPGSAQRIDLIKNTASATTGSQLSLTGQITGGGANLTLRVTSDTSGDTTTTYRFAGNNSFAGKVELFRGAIVVASATGLGTATVQLNGNNNTTLGDLRFESAMTFANNIELVNTANPDPIHTNGNTVVLSGVVSSSGDENLVKIGAGTLVLAGSNTYTVGTTISGGILQVGNGGTTGTLGSTSGVTNNASLVINRSDAFALTQVISGTGTLVQAGAGTTTVSGTNTFSGDVSVTGGVLAVGTVAAGGTAQPLGQGTTPVTISGGGQFNYTGAAASWNRGITVTSGTGTVRNSGGGTLNLTGPVSKDGTTLVLSGTQAITVSGTISGASAGSDLTVDGTTVTLASANTYNGLTQVINGGALVAANTSGSATGSGNVQATGNGSTILGNGTLSPGAGGSVILGNGAVVSVGNAGDTSGRTLTFTPASGSMTTTFQTGSTLDLGLFSGAGLGDNSGSTASADLFRWGGDMTLQSGVKLRVTNVNGMSGFQVGDTWKLLDWSTFSGTTPTGTFDVALLELPALTGMGWDLSQLYTAGTIAVMVPEPARLSLALSGLGLLVLRRRRGFGLRAR